MNNNTERLRVELKRMQTSIQNDSLNKNLYENNKLEVHVFLDEYKHDNLELAQFITNHIVKRGFEDAVEMKVINIDSEKQMDSFLIIGYQLIKNLDRNEIVEILNQELDEILYNALIAAKKDRQIPKVA